LQKFTLFKKTLFNLKMINRQSLALPAFKANFAPAVLALVLTVNGCPLPLIRRRTFISRV